MDIEKEDIGASIMGFAALLGFAAIGALLLYQGYIFLADGVWHWFTVAEIMTKLGHDPTTLVDPTQTWEWVGIGKAANWIMYSAYVVTVALILAGIIFGVGCLMIVD